MSERSFDVVVVGAGVAGRTAAERLAHAGLSVAIVEPDLVGGECPFWACMPSKSLLRPEEALTEARRIPGAAQAATGKLDVAAVLARRDEVIHHLDDSSYLPGFKSQGIELVREHGRLDGTQRVRAGDEVLVARKAVIVATGTGAAIPPIDGLRDAQPWTNRELTTARAVPSRLAILGGGAVGAEMAQAWCTLASQVTLIEAMDRLLGREEPFAAAQVATSLRERGVDVRLGARAAAVRREQNGGEVTIELEQGPEVRADELAVAAGRRPRTDDLGLETVGLEPGEWIDVDDQLRATGVDGHWLYAVGDVNARALLTHIGKYQARVASENILGRSAAATSDGPQAPRVLFTDPQVAAVGHTLQSARDAGLNVHTVEAPTSGNAGGNFYGRNAVGTTRLVIDDDRGVVVGATITGSEVADFPARRHDRRGRRGAARTLVSRRARVSHPQRSLGQPPGAAWLLMEQAPNIHGGARVVLRPTSERG
jgi:pyruvate/2-oxoglutarate dehydrogenase complex dihydrolipoamide dehydrogenase (E3) component